MSSISFSVKVGKSTITPGRFCFVIGSNNFHKVSVNVITAESRSAYQIKILCNTYHVFTLANGAIVLNTADNLAIGRVAAKHSQDKTSIGTEDGLTGLNRGGKRRIGACKLLAVSLEVVVGRESDTRTLDEIDFLGAVGEESGSDFGSLGVEEDTCDFFIKDERQQ